MDFYNMSSAISSGDMRGEETSNMNDRIRESNKAKIIAQKNAVSQDKSIGVMKGIKSGIGEAAAGSQAKASYDAYTASVKAPAGAAGFSEVQTTAAESAPKAALPGETIDAGVEAPSAAITTSEGTLKEGSDIVTKTAGLEADATSLGSKVAAGTMKAVGIGGAVATAGLDIAQDFKGGSFHLAGDNWEEKISNLGNIGGAALDMVGLIPGLQLAGVIGSGLSAASGVLDATGEAVATAKAVSTDSAPVQQTQLMGQQTLAGSVASQRN